jgi:hypothetical protein
MQGSVGQRGDLIQRGEMRRVEAQDIDVGLLCRFIFALRREDAGAFQRPFKIVTGGRLSGRDAPFPFRPAPSC